MSECRKAENRSPSSTKLSSSQVRITSGLTNLGLPSNCLTLQSQLSSLKTKTFLIAFFNLTIETEVFMSFSFFEKETEVLQPVTDQ